MRTLVFLVIFALPSLLPASLRAESRLPICAADEFLAAFHTIVDHQALFDEAIADLDELARVSEITLQKRGDLASLPICADALAIQRLLIELGGDAMARAALDLAGLPSGASPYRQRLPDDQARIEILLEAMLGIDRSEAMPAEARELPDCAADDWGRLDEAAATLLGLADAKAEKADALSAIDDILRWREETLKTLPACAESINLLQAISQAATDAAALLAFSYSERTAALNPFHPGLEASLGTVREWRDQYSQEAASQTRAPAPGSYGSNQLPSCADAELTPALDDLQAEVAALLDRAERAASSADLTAFGHAQIALRDNRLASLPHCAEAFELRWRLAEVLADAALQSAVAAGAPAAIARDPGSSAEGQALVSATWAMLESLDATPSALGDRRAAAPACADTDLVFFFAYLAPAFWQLSDAALALALPQEVPAFIDQSYAFRQLLWEYLPRCGDALEMGLLMRSVAADAVAMLALELAGAPVWDIPYLPRLAGDIHQFFERAGDFISPCGSLDGASKTYYVSAANIANIRACASTTCAIVTTAARGQRLDVVDDMSNWYEIVLPNCETAFIAGFLASQTPPAR